MSNNNDRKIKDGKKMQRRILKFDNAAIVAAASVVGKDERDGPLGEYFDLSDPTDKFGMSTWELAESEMQRLAFNTSLEARA